MRRHVSNGTRVIAIIRAAPSYPITSRVYAVSAAAAAAAASSSADVMCCQSGADDGRVATPYCGISQVRNLLCARSIRDALRTGLCLSVCLSVCPMRNYRSRKML